MAGQITTIYTLPNGEQAFQKLECIRLVVCIYVLKQICGVINSFRNHMRVRTFDEHDITQMQADREFMAIDLANVKATLQELINSYRQGEPMTVDGIMSTVLELQEAINDD